jgi:hypothetical protein
MKDFMILRRKKLPNSQNIQYLVQEKNNKDAEPFEVVLHGVSGNDPLSCEVDCKLKVAESAGQQCVEAMCCEGTHLIKRV